MYQIHLTQEWTFEQIAPFLADLAQAMVKIAARFPDDIDLAGLARQIVEGEVQLWLILDERDKFIAFLTSQIEITPSGKKRLLLLELAGKGGVSLCDLLEEIENWARTQGVVDFIPVEKQ